MSTYTAKEKSFILESIEARLSYYRCQAYIYKKANAGMYAYYQEKIDEFKALEKKYRKEIEEKKQSLQA